MSRGKRPALKQGCVLVLRERIVVLDVQRSEASTTNATAAARQGCLEIASTHPSTAGRAGEK